MGKELVVVLSAVCLIVLILLGTTTIYQEQRLECISLVKDKPAAEVVVICK